MKTHEKKNYGFWGLLPLILFIVLYVGCMLVFSALNYKDPTSMMPRQTAILIALVFALFFFEPKEKLSKKLDIYLKNAGNSTIMSMSLILLMAGAFAQVEQVIGGQKSLVNLGISLIPSNLLIPGIFIIAAVISLCIGTSTGTLVTMLPITLSLTQVAHLNPGMSAAAVLSGALFGDGLSMIGGTTVTAAIGVHATMKDKFIWQIKVAIPSALITAIIYAVLSGNVTSSVKAGSFNLLTVIPYILVLVLAVVGMNVVTVITLGTILAIIIGMICGTASFFASMQAIGLGMQNMFWICVFAFILNGIVTLMREYGGVDWVVQKFSNSIHSKTSCEILVAILTFLVSGIIGVNNIGVLVASPIADELGNKYQTSKPAMAAILAIFAVMATMVFPNSVLNLMAVQSLHVSYFDCLKYLFYPLILIIITFVVIYVSTRRKNKGKIEND